MFSTSKGIEQWMYLSCSVLFLLMIGIHGQSQFLIFLDSITCAANPKYALPPNCSFDNTKKPPRGFIDLQLIREVPEQKYSLNLSIAMNNKKRTLMSLKNYDACAFFEGRVTTLLKIFKEILDDYGTLPKKCPVDKDFQYLFKDIVVDLKKFPFYLLETDFNLITRNTVGKEFLFSAEFSGRIRRSYENMPVEKTKKKVG